MKVLLCQEGNYVGVLGWNSPIEKYIQLFYFSGQKWEFFIKADFSFAPAFPLDPVRQKCYTFS